MKLNKYIKAKKLVREYSKKTDIYKILNIKDNALLGKVIWNRAWRQYCFYTFEDWGALVFNNTCLHDIAIFLEKINLEHKENLYKTKIEKRTVEERDSGKQKNM